MFKFLKNLYRPHMKPIEPHERLQAMILPEGVSKFDIQYMLDHIHVLQSHYPLFRDKNFDDSTFHLCLPHGTINITVTFTEHGNH